ncbi:MAG: phosphatase [Fibrobacter sp.]|nr:phosphatase [Fibrobacter sp.]
MTNPKFLASIDIGTYSCILLVASVESKDGVEKLVPKLQKVEVCRLGEDIFETGAVSEKRLQDLMKILSRFRSTLNALGVQLQAAIMTEAMRKASNSDLVIERVEKSLWIRPQIISGEEEAAYSFMAVSRWYSTDVLSLDIGGGSTELSLLKKNMSIPVGALALFKQMGAIPGPEYKQFVKGIFKEHPVRAFAKKEIVLIGGTATALAMVYLNLSEFDYEKIEGLELHLNDLEMVTTRISNLSKDLRAMLPGLENGRSDVIICGLYWLKSLLERLHVTSFKISTAGIRFGVLYSSLENTHATQ